MSISDCPIKSWSTLEILGEITGLLNFSVSNLPVIDSPILFSDEYKAAEVQKRKWYLIVAHMPNIEICNRTPIDEDLRTDAERFCIRYIKKTIREKSENQERELNYFNFLGPSIYRKLLEKHGEVSDLAEINLKPENIFKISIEFYNENNQIILSRCCKNYNIDVSKTFEEIKIELCTKIFDIPVLGKRDYQIWRIIREKNYDRELDFRDDRLSIRDIANPKSKVSLSKKMYQLSDWEDGFCLRVYV